jgi:hypothetical protein
MSVAVEGEVVYLRGECRVEDAEPLLALLQSAPGRLVDLSGTGHLHAAVVQLLLAFRPPLAGPAADDFTARWLMPLLAEQPGQGAGTGTSPRGAAPCPN